MEVPISTMCIRSWLRPQPVFGSLLITEARAGSELELPRKPSPLGMRRGSLRGIGDWFVWSTCPDPGYRAGSASASFLRGLLGPGSVRIARLSISTVFWSGTRFASVRAARLAGRRLYIKESVKNHFCKSMNVHILMRIYTFELRIGARVV